MTESLYQDSFLLNISNHLSVYLRYQLIAIDY